MSRVSVSTELVVLDRDGVINVDSDDYIKSADEWRPIPGSLEAIGRLTERGVDVAVISNQSGIARGLLDEQRLAAIDSKMRAGVAAAGGRLAGVYYCPHHPDAGCECRKPRTGLLEQLARDLDVSSFAAVPVIGDKTSDLDLARAIGARGILVRTGKGRVTEAALAAEEAVEVYDDLASAVDALLDGDRSA
jgi:D-glycero-D-manno-heptose 1,7-bisphosphate phosphatase